MDKKNIILIIASNYPLLLRMKLFIIIIDSEIHPKCDTLLFSLVNYIRVYI